VVQLKRDLKDLETSRGEAEEKMNRALKEKLSLASSFERLKEQLHQVEADREETLEREKTIAHDKGVLARRLEKAESSNSELAAKIREEQSTAIANRGLISKLETQLRENESETVRQEQERSAELERTVRKWRKSNDEAVTRAEGLQKKLEATLAEKSDAEDAIQKLRDEKRQIESERESTSKLLEETEKKRASLASSLKDQTELAEDRGRTIDELRADLAGTIERFEKAEEDLVARHQEEVEKLHGELHDQRTAHEKLIVELENTRVGMSDAIRRTREHAEAERGRILSEGHSKLSEVEEELGRVLRGREEMEAARDRLEDELNDRDEKIERLSETIEDLRLQLRDEGESRDELAGVFEKTKEGLSSALHLNRLSLDKTRTLSERERERAEELDAELKQATETIDRLESEAREQRETHEKTLQDWEARYEKLREEKLTLASEDANLKRIREQIREAQSERREVQGELEKLRKNREQFASRQEELESQRELLLEEREQLKAELNGARSELEKARGERDRAEQRERKLADSITNSEKRISSLRNLEGEIEQAIERKRKQGMVSRGDIFSETAMTALDAGDEFSREEFYRKLIAKLDLIDDLSKRYENRWRYPRVAEQLALLKSSFLDFLHDHSVKEFNLEPGTVLSTEERKRIKLVPLDESVSKKSASRASRTNGHQSKVLETIRPGYVFRDGSRDVIIRKAEVVVA